MFGPYSWMQCGFLNLLSSGMATPSHNNHVWTLLMDAVVLLQLVADGEGLQQDLLPLG